MTWSRSWPRTTCGSRPLDGGRAWRVSADQVPVRSPRFSPDGTQLAWTSRRDGAPEVHVAPVDGGPARRLTYWGGLHDRCSGWTPDGEVRRGDDHRPGDSNRSRAHAVPLDGGPAERLPYGWVDDVAFGPDGQVVAHQRLRPRTRRGGSATAAARRASCGSTPTATASSPDPAGADVAADARRCGSTTASRSCPTTRASAACTRVLPDGTDLRRHTEQRVLRARRDHRRRAGGLPARRRAVAARRPRRRAAPARHPARRPAHRPRSRTRSGVRPRRDVSPDRTGRASAVEVRGTVHWVTHRDGPVRALAERPGVRARLPRVRRRDRPRRVGDRRRRRGRPGDRAGRRRRTGQHAAPDRRRPARPGARPGRRRRTAAASRSPRTTAGCCWSTSTPARCARSCSGPNATRQRPRLLAGLGLAGVVAPRPEPVAAHQDGQHDRSVRRGRDAAAVHRLLAGVHRGRPVPGVPVGAQLRPGVRRARVRPVLPDRLPPAPGAAGRDDAVAVRPAAPAAVRSGTSDKDKDDEDDDASMAPRSTSTGWPTASCRCPVPAARYAGLRAAKSGPAVAAQRRCPACSATTWPRRTPGRRASVLERFDLDQAEGRGAGRRRRRRSRSAATASGWCVEDRGDLRVRADRPQGRLGRQSGDSVEIDLVAHPGRGRPGAPSGDRRTPRPDG